MIMADAFQGYIESSPDGYVYIWEFDEVFNITKSEVSEILVWMIEHDIVDIDDHSRVSLNN